MLPTNYHLQLVTDHRLINTNTLPKVIECAINGGVNVVQLRNKIANKNKLYQVGLQLKQLLSPLDIPLIVNDHIDVALAIDADGIHIGQDDLPYRKVREILGSNKLIGLTINTLDEARMMGNCGADYFGVSPIFLTQTKPELKKALGYSGLKAICHYLMAPAIAIGGLQPEHVPNILSTGASGIAVASAILNSNSPQETAAEFTARLRNLS